MASATHTDSVLQQLSKEAEAMLPWILERRRHLHRHPEVSFKEEKTAAFVRAQLADMGLEPAPPVKPGRHGFHLDIKSPRRPDKFILLRADMDALPVQEETGLDCSSTIPGVGHMCGHDTHTSMLLGAVKLLKDRADELPIGVRFVFQHAEEVSPGGARDFVEAGLTDDVLGCFGIHVSPRIASHYWGLRVGPTMAQAGMFVVHVRGRGGHGAAPHETIDPMPAAAACVMNLQQIVSRRIPFGEPCVVSVCQIHGGSASNIIPDEIMFSGTYRSFSRERVTEIERMIKEICQSTAATYGCVANVQIDSGYPPLVNDERAVEASRDAIARLFGEQYVTTMKTTMGGEDFAYFALARPSSFVFLGVKPDAATFYPLHHAKFAPDEQTLWRGSALLASMPFLAPAHLEA